MTFEPNVPGQRIDLPDADVSVSGKGITGMEYKIIGSTLQAVILELDPGETIYSESGGMAWMSGNITMNTSGRGGGIGGGRGVEASGQRRVAFPGRVHQPA